MRTSPPRPRDRAGAGTCPILIVHGDADTYVPFADAQLLHDVARAPKELLPIAGATHATMFSAGGAELTDRIARFISRDVPAKPMP